MNTTTNGPDLIYGIEERSINAWPALQTELYQGAVLRFADGYTKRSNSANALYFRGGLEALAFHVEAAYRRRKLPSVFKILDDDAYRGLDAALAARGYDRVDATTVKICELADRDRPYREDVIIEDAFTPAWINGYIAANFLEPKRTTVETLLGNILVDKLVASIREGGEPIAFGFGAIERGYVGFFDIHVKAEHRGRGFGRAIMEAIIGAAGARGVKNGYLQVMDNNLPAIELYGKLGFSPLYHYWYRRKP